MFIENQCIKSMVISLTHICNSQCKLCDRFASDEKVGSQLSKKQIDNLLTPKILEDLVHVRISGNTGEPTLGKNLVYIIQKLRELKSSVSIHISTNGDTQSIGWWKNLATIHPLLQVTFCLDGLTNETHQMYRTTNVDNVFRNMMAFKNAGGYASWQFILFRHNQPEIEQVRKICQDNDLELLIILSRRYTDELQGPTIDAGAAKCGIQECTWHRGMFFVRPDGCLRICCYRNWLTRPDTMNLSDYTADEILSGSEFKLGIFLTGLNDVCIERCNEINDDSTCQRVGKMLLSRLNDRKLRDILVRIGNG